MPILKQLKEVFDNAKLPYEVYNHALAYTAQEIAEKQHFPGNEMAKVVMLEVDGELVMGVIAGNHKIDPDTVRENLDARRVRLAAEDDFISRFPGCEIGAMPPFGNLFGFKVFVDPAFGERRIHLFQRRQSRANSEIKVQGFRSPSQSANGPLGQCTQAMGSLKR